MPKIIENIREQLLAETRAQVESRGYGSTTVRSVATACGIAVGTVYNYFPSKDAMVAAYMQQDWQCCLAEMEARRGEAPEPLLRGIYDALRGFLDRHRALFRDASARRRQAEALPLRHDQLRKQIAALILPICREPEASAQEYLAAFIAEAIISWAQADTPFAALYGVLERLIPAQPMPKERP